MTDTRRKEIPTDESDSSKRTIGKPRQQDTQLRWARIAFILSVLSFLSGPLLFFLMSLGVFGYGSGNFGIAIGLAFLLSFFGIAPCLAIAALCIALYRWGSFPISTKTHRFKIATFMILGLGFLFWGVLFEHGGEHHRWPCSFMLRQCDLVCKLFLEDSPKGYYPELSPQPGRLMFARGKNLDLEPFFSSTYLCDPTILVCPKDVLFCEELQLGWRGWDSEVLDQMVNDRCYLYLGYVVLNDREVKAFAKAYRERIVTGKRFDEDLKTASGEGNCGTDTLYQLREGIASVLTNGATQESKGLPLLAEIPVMIERVENNHDPKGGHVLYMDGHVEYLPYPGKWPMTETTIATLQELANLDGKPRVEESHSRIIDSAIKY